MAKDRRLIFLTGASEEEQLDFWKNYLRHAQRTTRLINTTSRTPAADEVNGIDCYFRDAEFFETENFIAKFMMDGRASGPYEYGLTEAELERSYPDSAVYIGPHPRHAGRNIINWVAQKGLCYNFEVIHFLPQTIYTEIPQIRIDSKQTLVQIHSLFRADEFQYPNGLWPNWIMPKDERLRLCNKHPIYGEFLKYLGLPQYGAA
jgi:hypothetical protein